MVNRDSRCPHPACQLVDGALKRNHEVSRVFGKRQVAVGSQADMGEHKTSPKGLLAELRAMLIRVRPGIMHAQHRAHMHIAS